MALNQYELAQNLSEIEFYVAVLKSKIKSPMPAMSEQEQAALKKLIFEFAETHNIVLINLLKQEQNDLLQLLENAFVEKRVTLNNETTKHALTEWMNKIAHAVSGQDTVLKTAHAKNTEIQGMADHLLKTGRVPPYLLGTDDDIRRCLGSIINSFEEITQSGHYVLPPVSLTESLDLIKEYLGNVVKALGEKNITGPVTLSIPANVGNNHWCLVKVSFTHGQISNAEIWSSRAGNSTKKADATHTLEAVIKAVTDQAITVGQTYAAIQDDGYTCADHVIQKICQEKRLDNEITRATGGTQLRYAVVETIAKNHKELGVPVATSLTTACLPEKGLAVVRHDNGHLDSENLKIYLDSQIAAQITFDECFAGELQKLYDNNRHSPENADKELVTRAFSIAQARFATFFTQNAAKDTAATGHCRDEVSTTTNNNPVLPELSV